MTRALPSAPFASLGTKEPWGTAFVRGFGLVMLAPVGLEHFVLGSGCFAPLLIYLYDVRGCGFLDAPYSLGDIGWVLLIALFGCALLASNFLLLRARYLVPVVLSAALLAFAILICYTEEDALGYLFFHLFAVVVVGAHWFPQVRSQERDRPDAEASRQDMEASARA